MPQQIHKTTIGGQAVLEGVMMKGPAVMAVAVRKPDGEVDVTTTPLSTSLQKQNWLKLPIIRGVVAFVMSMVIGVQALMKSADYVDIEERDADGNIVAPTSAFDKVMTKLFGDRLKEYAMYFSMVLSLVIGIALFMLLPTLLAGFFHGMATFAKNILEGLVRLSLFIGYITAISRMKDIQRVFEYHGAEHKTIFCYEHGDELTVDNVRKYSRLHPRCGTSFLIIVMIVSVAVFSTISWSDVATRMIIRLALLPVVAGFSYEIIRFAGRHDNLATRIVSAPGMWLQGFTTREPDDGQIEVAIAALAAVVPSDKDLDRW